MKPKEIMTPLQSAQAYLLDVEHELADANDRIRLLVAERNTARLQADQRVSLREEFRELLGTDEIEQGVVVVRGLQDRIKRLQEAGDAMLDVFSKDPDKISFDDWVAITTDVRTNWLKAKEDKP
jgi:hypothetical protein